jgi:formylglycine-generating enzyme required for sulfatase activity
MEQESRLVLRSSYIHEAINSASELRISDMSGNLWEWTGSWYPGQEGLYPVMRGGFWGRIGEYCAVDIRDGNGPAPRDFSYGFRVALSAAP